MGDKWTERYRNSDYEPTLNSEHPQTTLWPQYLPKDENRVLIFERSKNAQLVVYSVNYLSDNQTINPSDPLTIQWNSWGWTDHPTSNGIGAIERKLAWGYSFKQEKSSSDSSEKKRDIFHLTLNAFSVKKAKLYLNEDGHPILVTDINGTQARLRKIYVKTKGSGFIPRVLYVELYGENMETGEVISEQCNP